MAYEIRPPGVIADVDASYCGYPNLFSLKINHGGSFTKFPGRSYVNGKVDFVDGLDVDLFSVFELHLIVEGLGYSGDKNKMYYHYLVPEEDLDFGLRALGNDRDVKEFSKHVFVHKLMSVYIEHGSTRVETYFTSPSKVQLRLVEVENDVCNAVSRPSNKGRLMLEWKDKSSQMSDVVEGSGSGDVRVGNVTQQSEGIPFDHETFFDFNPFENQSQVTTNEAVEDGIPHGDGSSEGNTEGSSEGSSDESSDSDFMFDEDTFAEEVGVDMSDFNLHVDKDVGLNEANDPMNEQVEVDVVNNETLDSASEVEGEAVDAADMRSHRRRLLRELNIKMRKAEKKWCFYVGQTFGSACEVKEYIKKHSIETRRELKMVKNDKTRIRVVCEGKLATLSAGGTTHPKKGLSVKNKGGRGKKTKPDEYICPWVLLVSKIKDTETWLVKTLVEKHTCLQSRNIKSCTYEFLSQQIVDQIEVNPEIPVKALQDQLQKKFEVGVSKMKAFRAKSKAKGQLKGDYSNQYARLRDYMQELLTTNPGTTIRLEVEPVTNPNVQTRVFQRIYVCLGALKDGFKATGREILGLDGAFMKGPFPGQLLTAVGLDPNNGIYPLAYAVVEAENRSSWTWFLQLIGEDLDLERNSNFTFISDRQKGIIGALETVFPSAEHRFCLRHLHENMKLSWKGQQYKTLLWKCATSTTNQQFQNAMAEFKEFNPINGMSMWAKVDVPTTLLPPRHHTPVGRPKKKRKRAANEEMVCNGRLSQRGKSITCGKCGNYGHNQRSCNGRGSSNNPGSSSTPRQ